MVFRERTSLEIYPAPFFFPFTRFYFKCLIFFNNRIIYPPNKSIDFVSPRALTERIRINLFPVAFMVLQAKKLSTVIINPGRKFRCIQSQGSEEKCRKISSDNFVQCRKFQLLRDTFCLKLGSCISRFTWKF